MDQGIKIIVIPVRDLARAKALYGGLLGVEPYADQPYYVGFRIGDQEIGLDPNGHGRGMTGPVGFCRVDDIHASLQGLVEAGAETVEEIRDVGGGRLTAIARDGDGNPIGLVQN